ncbi:MAG: hypothetical protein R3240_13225 [Gammaproteobacteria bacterium]|nr:hypothetical protein [Gammaproteobacteria bacterium]
MKTTLIIHDEDARGNRIHTVRVPNEQENPTIRDLIQLRISNEIERFNTQRPVCFFSLVQPEGAEITSRGYRLKEHRSLDAEAQTRAAIAGFEKKSFLVNANGRDYQSLDDKVELKDDTEIVFVKFVEVVGG